MKGEVYEKAGTSNLSIGETDYIIKTVLTHR